MKGLYKMKKFDKWWMPDDEEHLTGWMNSVGNRQDGRLTYQYGKYAAAKPFIKQMRTVIDIGAHIGLWSYFFAKDFDVLAAFEPFELHQECWKKNMEGIENAALYKYALGEESGHVMLETRTAGSSGDTQVKPGEKGNVEIRTLDSFNFQEVDFIKIDCEGFEEFVLRGGKDTLERCKPCVIVEQKGDMSGRYGLKKLSAVKFLEKMGAKLRIEISGDYILSWD